MVEIKSYKLLALPTTTVKNAVLYILNTGTNEVDTYITDMNGIPIALKDLSSGSSGVQTVTNIDGSVTVTGLPSTRIVSISVAMQALINGALQSGSNISNLVNNVGYITLADIPVFNPLDYDLTNFNNSNINPFARISDLPVGGATNLSYTPSPTQGLILSDTGTDAIIPLANLTEAGLLSPSEKIKIGTALQPGSNITQLANDAGFITLGDIPAFVPSNYDLIQFNNLDANPFARISDIANSGAFIPLAGTDIGSPVTGVFNLNGDVRFQNLLVDNGDEYYSGVIWNTGTLNLGSTYYNSTTLEYSTSSIIMDALTTPTTPLVFNAGDGYILIVNNGISKGLVGAQYYGANYDDNTYVQRKYVTDNFLLKPTEGTIGQVLTTNGAGVYTWNTVGGGTPQDLQSILDTGGYAQSPDFNSSLDINLANDTSGYFNSYFYSTINSSETDIYQTPSTVRLRGLGAVGSATSSEGILSVRDGKVKISQSDPNYTFTTTLDFVDPTINNIISLPASPTSTTKFIPLEFTDGTTTVVSNSLGKVNLSTLSLGGGGGATNLTYTASPTNGTVVSDTGTDATIPLADVTNAGLLSPSEKILIASALQSEANNLTAAVTWANVPNANITQASVVQHQAALSITESQISDLNHFIPSTLLADYSFIDNSTNWNTAFGWGDHSIEGYLKNIVEDTTPGFGGEVNAQGNNIIDLGDVTFQTGASGGTLRTGTSNADKFELQAYDVNDGIYRKVLEVDAGNTVTLEVFADSFRIWDNIDETKQLKFTLLGGTTGVTTELIHSPTANRTITFPDSNGTLELVGHTHTFAEITSTPTTLGGYGITDAYPLVGNPSGFLTSFTETDPTVPAYAKSLTSFSVIQSSTNALYQSTLVSGTNIKTINGNSLLGSGDLVVGGGSSPWVTTGSDIYYNTGRVGIGTTSPANQLHIAVGSDYIQMYTASNVPTLRMFKSGAQDGRITLPGVNFSINTGLVVNGVLTTTSPFSASGLSSSYTSVLTAPTGALSLLASTGNSSHITFGEQTVGWKGALGLSPSVGDLIYYTNPSLHNAFNGTERFRVRRTDGVFVFNAFTKAKGSTVATLPTGEVGLRGYVTDATVTTFGSTVVGGGANTVPVFYDGTNWIIA